MRLNPLKISDSQRRCYVGLSKEVRIENVSEWIQYWHNLLGGCTCLGAMSALGFSLSRHLNAGVKLYHSMGGRCKVSAESTLDG